MSKLRSVFPVCVMVLLWSALPGSAYEMGIYSSWSYDSGSGQAYAYAQTWYDYSSAYYYDAYADVYLFVTPIGGSTYVACQAYGHAVSSGAEASCSAQVEGDFDYNLNTQHQVDVTYYVYQFDPYCTWDCYYWWDSYETSLLGVGGQTYSDNTSWLVPGPPAARVPEQATIRAGIDRYGSEGSCRFPTGESSYFRAWSWNYYFAAGFAVGLQDPSSYDDRTVGENLTAVQPDTCKQFFPTSPYDQFTLHRVTSTWPVGQLWGDNYGTYNYYIGPSHNAYGLDYAALTNEDAVRYYQDRIRNEQTVSQCGVFYTQHMWMDGCGGPSQYYKPAHELSVAIKKDAVTMRRQNSSASR